MLKSREFYGSNIFYTFLKRFQSQKLFAYRLSTYAVLIKNLQNYTQFSNNLKRKYWEIYPCKQNELKTSMDDTLKYTYNIHLKITKILVSLSHFRFELKYKCNVALSANDKVELHPIFPSLMKFLLSSCL